MHFTLPSKFKTFKRKIPIEFKVGKLTVKTAENSDELAEALKLRFISFFPFRFFARRRLDVTLPFDLEADHLIVLEKDKVIGNYRFISNRFTSNFYSSKHFHIEKFVRDRAQFSLLEASRACVDPSARGMIIPALWRGMYQYMEAVQVRYTFGCSSIHTMSLDDAANYYWSFVNKGLYAGPVVEPIRKTPDFRYHLEKHSYTELDIAPPALLGHYFGMGAKIYSEPAYDTHFRCLNFFTVLDQNDLTDKYKKLMSR